MTVPPSPGILQPPPKRAPGVKRLNAMPYYFAGTAALLAMCGIGYTMLSRANRQQSEVEATEAAKKPKAGTLPGFLTWPNDHGDIQATVTKPVAHGEIQADKVAFSNPPQNTAPAYQQPVQSGPPDLEEQARTRAWAAYYQQTEAVQTARINALTAGRTHQNDQQERNQPPQQPGTPGQQRDQPADGKPYSLGGTDPAGQTGKQAFLRTPGDVLGQDEDLGGSVHGVKLSTIMEGSIIPARLVDGATSDQPGQITAEVLTDVNDSATGNILLIPQWTRLVGEYDVAVSAGQDRLGVIWHRMIFPDTSSRQIGSMPGADQAGLAGLKDQLDTHLFEKFSSALLISLVGAGAQLAQPQQSAFSGYSPGSSATGQFTQQFSQLGQAYAQRGLSIPNTIQLRSGLLLNVKVTKDMPLPAYMDHRDVAGR